MVLVAVQSKEQLELIVTAQFLANQLLMDNVNAQEIKLLSMVLVVALFQVKLLPTDNVNAQEIKLLLMVLVVALFLVK